MVRGNATRLRAFATILVTVVALVTLGTCLAYAQSSTAAILGVVRDTSGALVPGVNVTVKHIESGLTRMVISGENGGYNIQFLPVGAYELTTDLPGFKQQM